MNAQLSTRPRGDIQVTVTFLEMKHPPRIYPPMPMNRPVAILRARAIPTHYFRYLMDRIGRKWDWVNILRMSENELADYLHADSRDVRVLYLDGTPVGFFDLMASEKEVDLCYFGLAEEAIGHGLGRWFLGAAVEAAWSYSPERVTVQTCTLDHPAALPLYQKIGFEPVAQTQSIVQPLSDFDRAAALLGADVAANPA